MDKIRHKSNKDKSKKSVDKEKTPLFKTDVKAIKENLKIKEILRTVKMNSSMRIKAPRGSKVMQNKDFNDNEDFEEVAIEDECASEPTSATNPNVITDPPQDSTYEEASGINNNEYTEVSVVSSDTSINDKTAEDTKLGVEATTIQKSNSFSESSTIMSQIKNQCETNSTSSSLLAPNDFAQIKSRKLSLDQTMLTRCEGLSQSELDLHSIGKSPLERKSSFFRKKMDSFFKNTTEIFKRQSLGSKSPTIQRRGSMSVSLHSLNENTPYNGDCSERTLHKNQEVQGSVSSLQSSLTTGHSNSSLSRLGLAPDTEEDSLAGSQPALTGSQPIGDISSNSVNSLNEICIQESLMNSRAISMSSGLDSAHGKGRRKASRSNRVTWLASEGLTNYFRRQEEKIKDMQVSYSYQDFSTIPENNLYGPKLDSKGRRLSYQRAVSGEDPVISAKYQDTLRRKPHIPENHVANFELSNLLAELARPYNPSLSSSTVNVSREALTFLIWTEKPENLVEYLNQTLSTSDEARQTAIRELICTEADYIRYLITSVEVFMSTARTLKEKGFLANVDTGRLFLNFPEVINANLQFWQIVLYPMIKDAVDRKVPFNTNLMQPGFKRFPQIFLPYERFVSEQKRALDYLRSLSASNPDFFLYITWCHSQEICNRLQLSDILAKPMQRLTKYNLILQRILLYTVCGSKRSSLTAMEAISTSYLHNVNRTIRQREEIEKIDQLTRSIEAYEMDFKDEDLERIFRMHSVFDLRMPMARCHGPNFRTLVHQVDFRFKDNQKEMDARIFLLTDMLLVCKKQPKNSSFPFKLVRPKYFLNSMVAYPKFGKNNELLSISYVVLDQFNTSYQCFNISESPKETNPMSTLKVWDTKFREAKLSYDYSIWLADNPNINVSVLDFSIEEIISIKLSADELMIDRDARERLAAMLHKQDLAKETESTVPIGSFDGLRYPRLSRPMARTSTDATSRYSRLSSFQKSTSAASHDEPHAQLRQLYRAGTSVEHVIPPQNPDGVPTSITVNVLGDCDGETNDVPVAHPLTQPTPRLSPPTCISSVYARQNTLLVHPQSGVVALMHSLPDLTNEPYKPRPAQSPKSQSPSDKRFQSQQELLQEDRSPVPQHHQFLTPDHRGTNHPPLSPTRASLQRGQAFCYSIKYPPLSKMGHVNSLSHVQFEAGLVTTQPGLDEPSTSRYDRDVDDASCRLQDNDDLSPTRKEDKSE